MTQYIAITKDSQELMHYGKLGMHWGKRTGNTLRTIGSVKPIHAIGSAGASAGKSVKKVIDENHTQSENSINRSQIKRAKKDRTIALNKSKDSFISDMHKLAAEGRGNDNQAVIKRSAQWDKERAAIRADHNRTMNPLNKKRARHKAKVARSVVSGIFVSNLASAAAFSLTGNPKVSVGIGVVAGFKSGQMMYDKLSDYDPR